MMAGIGVQHRSESAFTFDRNRRSRWAGIRTTGRRRILRRVAKGRQPSLGDSEMRHGRKSRHRPFTRYTRHVVQLLGPDLIVEAVARPANEPEHAVLATLTTAVAQQGPLSEVWMDRGYLASAEIPVLHARGVTLHAKPWTARNGDRFPKHAFVIHLADGIVECPAHQTRADSAGAPDRAVCRRGVPGPRGARRVHDGRGGSVDRAASAGSVAPTAARDGADTRRPSRLAPPHHRGTLVGAP
jgi:hypothetical protein